MDLGILIFIISSVIIPIFYCITALIIYKQKNKEIINLNNLECKPISLLIPCYNESVVIKSSISSIKKIDYPNLEVIFINDGSNDDTLKILQKELNLKLVPNRYNGLHSKNVLASYQSMSNKNIFVIDKENGGKADSLNAGINFASLDYVATLDADSILKDNALYHINHTLQDNDIIAVGGNVVAAQGVHNTSGPTIFTKFKGKFIERAQFIEYLRGFFILKNAYSKFNALSVISGAFGVFNKKIVFEVDGFEDTVGEDIDITIKFARYAKDHNMKISYNDRAMCFTELPNTWRDLFKQRVRWQKAFLDALKNHFSFIFKNCLTDTLAFVMLFENFILMYTSTIITFVGIFYMLISLLMGNPIDDRIYVLFAIGMAVYLIYNIVAFTVMKVSCLDTRKLSFISIVLVLTYEFFFYRPIMNIIILYGSVEFLFNPGGWNKVERIGANDSILDYEEMEKSIS